MVDLFGFEPQKNIKQNNQSKGLSIVGASRNNGEREENDFYPTPPTATQALLDREKFDGNIFEPACGDGAISKVCIDNGYDVFSTDLIYRGYGEGNKDFLRYNGPRFDNLITNPPFSLALEFVQKAKSITNNKVAMFLKTVFLESDGRFEMFHDKVFPLKYMYQFSYRVSIYKSGIKMKNSGLVAYAWFIWDKNYQGEPMIRWIKK